MCYLQIFALANDDGRWQTNYEYSSQLRAIYAIILSTFSSRARNTQQGYWRVTISLYIALIT